MEVLVVERPADLLAESFYVLQRVHTRREDEEYGRGRSGLLKGFGEFHGAILNVLRAELLLTEIPENQEKTENTKTTLKNIKRRIKIYNHWIKIGTVPIDTLKQQTHGNITRFDWKCAISTVKYSKVVHYLTYTNLFS